MVEAYKLEVPDNPSLKLGTGNLSVDAWVGGPWVGAPSLPAGIVDKLDVPAKKGYAFYVQNHKLNFVMGDGSSLTTYTSTSQVNFVPSNTNVDWHHVAVTVDRLSQKHGGTFYIDGVAAGTFTPLANNINIGDSSPLFIGGSRMTGVDSREYYLDEIEIFNGVVSASDILAIFNAGSARKCRP